MGSLRQFFGLFLIFSAISINAQQGVLADKIYDDNIRSVQFHVRGLPLSYPIVDLSNGQLELNFDDIAGNDHYYYYTIVHCDRSWRPSQNIQKFEYIDGYENEEIRDYEFSFGTDINYTHYALNIPNDDMGWKLSGNYVLIITDEDDELIMTRRFMVVDMNVRIIPELVRPAMADKFRSHQEIDFKINTLNTRIVNAEQEITAVVLKNGRWDNAITELKHRFNLGDELSFDYSNKVVFPAGKEYRHIDITSLQYRSFNVQEINHYENVTEVVMKKTRPRKFANFYSDVDINGKFVIKTDDRQRSFTSEFESVDFNKESLFNYGNSNLSSDQRDEIRSQQTKVFQNNTKDHLESEYAEIIVSIETDQPFDRDIYALGAMSDWKLDERFKLNWDDRLNGYIGKFLLKQGFYDYVFAVPDENFNPDISAVEGDWYQTFNDYTILCYYKPFAGRYEELIGAFTFDTDVQIKY